MQDLNALKAEGNAYMAKKDYAKAVESYTKAIQIDPSNHVLYSNRSAAYLADRKFDEALADGKKCTELNPTWGKGYCRVGAAYQALKQYDNSIAAYNEGIEKCGKDDMLTRGLNEVNQKKQEEQAGNMIIAAIMNVLFTDPSFASLRNDVNLISTLQQIREGKADITALFTNPKYQDLIMKALGMGVNPPSETPGETPEPKRPEPKKEEPKKEEPAKSAEDEQIAQLKQEGNDLYKKKNFAAALEKYGQILSIQPHNFAVRNNVAAVYLEQGQVEQCIEYCQTTLEQEREFRGSFEDVAKTYLRMGNAELKRENYDQALEYFLSSRTETPVKGIEDRIKLANKLKAEAAKKAYVNPEEGLKAKERGNKLFMEGNYAAAIHEYDDAIKRDPTNASFYNNRGTAFSKLMDYGRAMEDIEKALKLNPEYVKAWMRKGNVEMALKQYHRSKRSFERGLQIDPKDEGCIDGLNRTMRKIEESCRLPPDPEQQRRAKEDPEIQAILSDPSVSQALQQLQQDPKAAAKILQDASLNDKIQTLIASGLIRLG